MRHIFLAIASVWAATVKAAPPATNRMANDDGVPFRDSFDDPDLIGRRWYDGDGFRIVGGARAGTGCIEYEWPDRGSKVIGSMPVRHLFAPTDEVYVRYYLTGAPLTLLVLVRFDSEGIHHVT